MDLQKQRQHPRQLSEAEAEDTYHSYKSFEKRVSANSDQDESGYQSGDQTYQYSKLDGNNLHYQLVVQTAAEDDADIVITDTCRKTLSSRPTG